MSAVQGPMPCSAVSAACASSASHLAERVEVDRAAGRSPRDRLQGPDLRRRQAERAAACSGARAPHGLVVERIERRARAAPRSPPRSRSRAAATRRSRHSPAKPPGRAAQRRPPGGGQHGGEARVGRDQPRQRGIEIGLGVDDTCVMPWLSVSATAVTNANGVTRHRPPCRKPVFRFAPSPNGYLHLGHALSALINFDMARAAGGRLLLRIEDIDADALPAGIRAGDL